MLPAFFDHPAPGDFAETVSFVEPAGTRIRVGHDEAEPRLGGIRRDMTNQWNANAAKNLHMSERVNLQFRAEFFNVFNNVNFKLPNSNISSAQAGKITAVVQDSQRIVQFGMKVRF